MSLKRSRGGSYIYGKTTEKKKSFWGKEKLVTTERDEFGRETKTTVTKGHDSVTIKSKNIKIVEKRSSDGTITRTTTKGGWGNRSKLTVITTPTRDADGDSFHDTVKETYKAGFGSSVKRYISGNRPSDEQAAADARAKRITNEAKFRSLQEVHNKGEGNSRAYQKFTGYKLHGSEAPIIRGGETINGKDHQARLAVEAQAKEQEEEEEEKALKKPSLNSTTPTPRTEPPSNTPTQSISDLDITKPQSTSELDIDKIVNKTQLNPKMSPQDQPAARTAIKKRLQAELAASEKNRKKLDAHLDTKDGTPEKQKKDNDIKYDRGPAPQTLNPAADTNPNAGYIQID